MPGARCFTGVAALDAVVESVLEADHIRYGWEGHHYDPASPPLSAYRDPELCSGACKIVSEPLERAFAAAGLYTALEVVQPHELGYAEEGFAGSHWPLHQILVVGWGGERFALDFAAAQYGEDDFPVVFQRAGGRWQRRGRAPAQALP